MMLVNLPLYRASRDVADDALQAECLALRAHKQHADEACLAFQLLAIALYKYATFLSDSSRGGAP